jgi:hypothetical protein
MQRNFPVLATLFSEPLLHPLVDPVHFFLNKLARMRGRGMHCIEVGNQHTHIYRKGTCEPPKLACNMGPTAAPSVGMILPETRTRAPHI